MANIFRHAIAILLVSTFLPVLSPVPYSFAATSVDLTTTTVGPRPRALGSAFVAISDDTNAVLTNPAGLAFSPYWSGTTMRTTLVGVIQNTLLSGTAPWGPGTVGGALFMADSPAGVNAARDAQGNVTATGGNITFQEAVAVVGYGTEKFPLKHLRFSPRALGVSLKYFTKNFSGINQANTGATGLNLDLGALWDVNSRTRAGFVARNILPSALGGVITWGNGRQEDLPFSIRPGISYDIRENLVAAADVDMNFRGHPMIFHGGLEWYANKRATLRLGLNQQEAALGGGRTGTTTHLTMGFGVEIANMTIDYAYQNDWDISDNTAHFISISFSGAKPPKRALTERYIELDDDKNLFVIRVPALKVSGRVVGDDVKKVAVKTKTASRTGKTFVALLPVEIGRSPFDVKAVSDTESSLQTLLRNVLRLKTFRDVGESHSYRNAIENTATLGLISGFPDGTYQPERGLTRAELVAFLTRIFGDAKGGAKEKFPDVRTNYWARNQIGSAAAQGWVEGYPSGKFEPARVLTRAEAISIFARFGSLPPGAAKRKIYYKDINSKHWAWRAIETGADAGLIAFWESDRFEPKKHFTRGEAAEIISRLPTVKEQIHALYR